jgi:uncharacterized protein YtpQ (UPF0354 family)
MGLIEQLFGPPPPDRFARQLMAALTRAGDPREARYNSEKFQIRFYDDGRDAGVANLRNFYDEHCRIPRPERPKHLKHVVRGLLTYLKEVPHEFSDARHDLRPIVRARSYFEFLRLQSEIEGHEPPNIPCHDVGDHLSAALVFDLPESMQSINSEQLDGWDISYYEALEVARLNLEETEFAIASVGERLYVSATGDNYDASRLLLVDLIERLDVQGRPVAVVPNRDTLVITGSEDETGLSLMADFAEQALQAPRPMSAIPMILDHGEWQTWSLEPDHPQYSRFRMLELKSMGGEYAEQKELLDTLHSRRGSETFVASFSAMEKPSGEVFSYCLWSKGVDALLPRTQKIMFFREDATDLCGGEWEHVASIVGDLLEPLPVYPPRFRVREFPTERQLSQIGRAVL